MKKSLPIVGILAALVIIIIVGIFMRSRNSSGGDLPEEIVPELPVHMRPVTSLTPTEDGHYLKLEIVDIDVPGASTMEYELLYGTAEGITQGVPGRVTLTGKQSVDRDLLLGSESSGKFRYDQGVDDGTLTLKFRDVDGKFIGKVETTWMLYSGTDELASADGKFTYVLDEANDNYFLVMQTFGIPNPPENLNEGPYGVFSASEDAVPGEVNLEGTVFMYDNGVWTEFGGTASEDIGIFLSVK